MKGLLEITPNWSADRWATDWYDAWEKNQGAVTDRSNAVLNSYVKATTGNNPKTRAQTPAVFSTALPAVAPTSTRHVELIDKLFMAIAQALVAVTLNTDTGQRTPGGIDGHNIGGLLVDRTNKIVGWGVNTVKLNATFHAETAMVQAYLQRNNVNELPEGCRVYATLEPCYMCAGFIATVIRPGGVEQGQVEEGRAAGADAFTMGAAAIKASYRELRIAVGTLIAERPPHRSVRADLSGSSAIAGFRPHGSHRAALPQWAPQKGPEAGRSLQPCLVDRWFWEGKAVRSWR